MFRFRRSEGEQDRMQRKYFWSGPMVTKRRTLEVCVASLDGALAAVEGGADRLELNAALELGGLTPSLGLFEQVRAAVAVPIIAMVRPRPGGFCYSERERQLMLRDAALLLDAGADGIATGAALSDRTVDREFWSDVVKLVAECDAVFHRAFDVLADQLAMIEILADLGTARVLTSGGGATALEGAEQIGRLVRTAAGRIEILPGAGVSSDNICRLIELTGCDQVHGSFSESVIEATGLEFDVPVRRTSRVKVAAARAALDAADGLR